MTFSICRLETLDPRVEVVQNIIVEGVANWEALVVNEIHAKDMGCRLVPWTAREARKIHSKIIDCAARRRSTAVPAIGLPNNLKLEYIVIGSHERKQRPIFHQLAEVPSDVCLYILISQFVAELSWSALTAKALAAAVRRFGRPEILGPRLLPLFVERVCDRLPLGT